MNLDIVLKGKHDFQEALHFFISTNKAWENLYTMLYVAVCAIYTQSQWG